MPRWWIVGWVLFLALTAFCSSTLRAADEHKAGAKAHSSKVKVVDHKHKEASFDLQKPEHLSELTAMLARGEVLRVEQEKLPSNPVAIAFDLGLWTIVVFVLLFLILRKVAWGPMLEGLQKREDNIRGALEDAKRARAEAESIRASLQKQLDDAAQTIREMMDEARRDAQRNREEMVSAARAEIQTERDRLRREMDTARDQALQYIWQQAAQLATLVSVKTVKKHLTADDHRQLVDEALAELRTAGRQRQTVA